MNSSSFSPNPLFKQHQKRRPSGHTMSRFQRRGASTLGLPRLVCLAASISLCAHHHKDGYLRSFFGRLGFHEDAEVVALMGGHMFGSARGFPYLGEWADSSVQSRDEVNRWKEGNMRLGGLLLQASSGDGVGGRVPHFLFHLHVGSWYRGEGELQSV